MHKLEGHIIINADDFFEAVKTANEEYMKISNDTPGDELVTLMMGLQNMAFGALIARVLFGEEESK